MDNLRRLTVNQHLTIVARNSIKENPLAGTIAHRFGKETSFELVTSPSRLQNKCWTGRYQFPISVGNCPRRPRCLLEGGHETPATNVVVKLQNFYSGTTDHQVHATPRWHGPWVSTIPPSL